MQPEEKKRILELAGYRIDIAKEDLQVAAENMAAGHLRQEIIERIISFIMR